MAYNAHVPTLGRLTLVKRTEIVSIFAFVREVRLGFLRAILVWAILRERMRVSCFAITVVHVVRSPDKSSLTRKNPICRKSQMSRYH